MPTPEILLRRDITVLLGSGFDAAQRIDLTQTTLLSLLVFVIDGQRSNWSVEPGQVTDVDDPEQISMFYYNADTNNKHLKKVKGY